jgi:hypothetical protein
LLNSARLVPSASAGVTVRGDEGDSRAVLARSSGRIACGSPCRPVVVSCRAVRLGRRIGVALAEVSLASRVGGDVDAGRGRQLGAGHGVDDVAGGVDDRAPRAGDPPLARIGMPTSTGGGSRPPSAP